MNFPQLTQNEDGFTLLEIITVIAIMGVLAGIAMPVFSVVRGKGNDGSVETHINRFHDLDLKPWMQQNPNSEVEASVAYGYEAPEGMSIQVAPIADTVNTGDYQIIGWHENGYKYTQENPLIWNSNDTNWSVKKVSS